MGAEFKTVSVQRLVLDENNPRFRRPMAQDEAIAEFAKSAKTRKLAKHISEHGLNPFDPIAVMAMPGTQRFIVREGNRRTAALKLMLNPDLASEPADSKFYAATAGRPDAVVPRSVNLVVIDDEKEMRRWIRLKHVADQSGVATLLWQPWEKANFDDGTGPAPKYKNARDLVNAAIENEWIDGGEHDRLNLSTLSRILDDTEARGVIGFSVDANGLHTHLGVDEQAALAKKLIAETGKGGKESSRTLRETKDLVRYAKQVARELKLKVDPKAGATRLGSAPVQAKATKKTPTRTKALPDDIARKHVVPRGFEANVTQARAADILKELRRYIDVHETPNAAAVLFRLFLEFSVHHYAETPANQIPPKGPKDDLNTVLVRVKEHLVQAGRIKKGQLAVINKAISTPDHFLSVAQLNQYVHNPLVHPNPREINSAWNGCSAFLTALWADYT
jgi:hypothetical protein